MPNLDLNTNSLNEEQKSMFLREYESRKMNPIAIFIVTFLLGLFGVHKFILGQKTMGLIYLCTAGLLSFGWFFDLFTIWGAVEKRNDNLARDLKIKIK
jgi:TM2 domain-containing membrane protein YozV